METLNGLTPGLALDVLVKLLEETSRLDNRESDEVAMDVAYVRRRFDSEGFPFLTVCLPALGRSLDRSLATGNAYEAPQGFKLNGVLPCFMHDCWTGIFGEDGFLLEEPSPTSVRLVRQVTYLWYKVVQDFDAKVVRNKCEDFLTLDRQLPCPDKGKILSGRTRRIVESARLLLSRLFEVGSTSPTGDPFNLVAVSPTGAPFDPSDIVPRHGPGAVADGVASHLKYRWKTFYSDLDQEYPYSEYFYLNHSHLCYQLSRLLLLDTRKRGYARLCAVPKDSRGPRLISMEPLEYQWIQQGLGRAIVAWVERHNHTRGYVNFHDQNINRDLALVASVTGSQDTLDLKDASDRVSLWLVRQLFPRGLMKKFEAARTAGTEIEGKCYDLRKFAPMGSALCFPVESLCFWSLALATLNFDKLGSGYAVCPSDLRHQVWVFGDDLIVPKGGLDLLRPVFEELDLQFNVDKCCTGKYFRESCGMDAFQGVCVTPIRIKHWGTSPNDMVALCETATAFAKIGYSAVAGLLYSIVELATGVLPVDASGERSLHRYHPSAVTAQVLTAHTHRIRYNTALQRAEYRAVQPSPHHYTWDASDWGELWRCWPDPERDRLAETYRARARLWVSSLFPEDRGVIPGTFRAWEQPSVRPLPCQYTTPKVLRLEYRWLSLR